MKRIGNLFNSICSLDNLRLAQLKARQGKQDQYGVKVFDRNPDANLADLSDMLFYKEFTTSAYKVFTVTDPKEREVYGLPFYPDRIVQHAIMNHLEKPFTDAFTADTYSSIKRRGIGRFDKNLKAALRNVPATQYCLQVDIRKFYPSIDHAILKAQLRRKFKDPDLLWLLDDIIDSAPGVPIGNYTSQFFANYYLTGFDHWIKEQLRVKYYFRYCDDIVILAADKNSLHRIRGLIQDYLALNLKLTLKKNYKVFPVSAGIDVCGYVYYHGYSLLRKSIKQSFARAVARKAPQQSINSYIGWAKHCNSGNLVKKLLAA